MTDSSDFLCLLVRVGNLSLQANFVYNIVPFWAVKCELLLTAQLIKLTDLWTLVNISQAITCSLTANQQYEGEKNTLLGILLSGDFPCTVCFLYMHFTCCGLFKFYTSREILSLKKIEYLGADPPVWLSCMHCKFGWEDFGPSLAILPNLQLAQPSASLSGQIRAAFRLMWTMPATSGPWSYASLGHGGVLVTVSVLPTPGKKWGVCK